MAFVICGWCGQATQPRRFGKVVACDACGQDWQRPWAQRRLEAPAATTCGECKKPMGLPALHVHSGA